MSEKWNRVTETAKAYHLYVLGIFFIAAVIPILFTAPQEGYLDKAAVLDRTFLKSNFCMWLSTISLCMYLPACLEIVLDVIASRFVKFDISPTLLTRLWVVVGGIATEIMMLKIPHASGSVVAYYGVLSIRGIVNATAFLHLTHLNCKELYTKRWTICLIILVCGGIVIFSYAVQDNNPIIAGFGIFFFVLGVSFITGTIAYHFLQEYRGAMNNKSTLGYEILYVLSIFVGICLGLSVRFAVINSQQNVSLSYRMGYTTFQSILLYVAVTHEFKWNFSAVSATLSTKQMFVRFVSHEVRTPLNACILGLEYLEGVCLHEDSLSPSVIVSLAKEIRDSCDDAVEIMNNLLLYEKVDGNALALSCASENIYHVVQKVFRSFQLGAQKLGVQTLLLVHPSINGPGQKDASSVHGIDMNSSLTSGSIEVITDGASDDNALTTDQALVFVDRPKLHVVLRNMVSNAIKFSTAYGQTNGKVIMSIDPIERYVPGVIGYMKEDPVCNMQDATYVRVSVQDNGAGISVGNQRRMFGSIVQFDQNKLQGGGGSGMGLYISNKIVSLHKGCKIEVYSKGEGYGTTVSVYMPLYCADSLPSLSNTEDIFMGVDLEGGKDSHPSIHRPNFHTNHDPTISRPKSSDVSMSSVSPEDISIIEGPQKPLFQRWLIEGMAMKDLSIIVVDDSGVNRRMLIRLLQRNGIGCVIKEAVDGVDFLQKMGAMKDTELIGLTTADVGDADYSLPLVEDNDGRKLFPISYDLCIVDQNMPNMNGSEAIECLRSLGYEGLIVGLTGATNDDDLCFMRNKGADFVITKPLHLQELVTILNMCSHGVSDSRAE